MSIKVSEQTKRLIGKAKELLESNAYSEDDANNFHCVVVGEYNGGVFEHTSLNFFSSEPEAIAFVDNVDHPNWLVFRHSNSGVKSGFKNVEKELEVLK